MSESSLPAPWAWSTFSEVAVIAANLVPPSDWPELPHIAPDNIERDTGHLLPFRTIQEDGVTSSKHLFRPGQILYSKIRPYLNKCVTVDFEGLCSADMYPVDPLIDRAFLHNYMLSQTFVKDVSDAAGTRTILPKTNQKQLSDVPIPVAPLPEQHRIVEAIESYFSRLDDAVATLERVQRNLKRYRASVLKAAVEGRLVPTEAELAKSEGRDYEPASVLLERILAERRRRWEEAELAKMKAKGKTPKNDKWKKKYKEPEAPDTEGLPELPEGWCWASVEQLASYRERSIQSGPFGSNLRHSEFQESGKLVLGIDNVQEGHFSIGANHRISEEKFRELERFRARPGDVLITVMATIGRCCVVPEDLEPAIITKHVYRVSPERAVVAPRYLNIALWGAPVVREQIFGKAQGQTRPGLNGTIIKQLAIPIPPPSEQMRIVEEAEKLASVHDAMVTLLAVEMTRMTRLRQSILKWAFEGKLADQDPSDEPASALLERIKAEQAKASPKKTRRGRKPSRKNA